MLDFADAQARLGESIAQRLANATLQLNTGLDLVGRLVMRQRDVVFGMDVAATEVEFVVLTRDLLGLDVAGALGSCTYRGELSWWRVSAATPRPSTCTTVLRLEAQRP